MQRLPLRPLRALAAAARAGTLFAVIACSSNDSGQGDADPDEPGGTSHARDSGVEAGSVMTASDAAGATLPELCSGCAGEDREVGDNVAHFHHVHINTHDLAASEAFYERVFGAIDVRLNDQADVLKADGAFLLFHEVAEPPTDAVDTGLEHFGWGRPDLLAWWDEAQAKDVRLDQRSGALTGPFELFTDYYFLYLQGPSNERIEVETETAEFDQLKHVHFMTDDVNATVGFYETLLGVTAEMPEATELMLASEFDGMPIQWSSNTVIVDKVKMIFFGPPFFGIPQTFAATDDHPVGHVAFAFADLEPVIERAQALNAEIVAGPTVDQDYGFRSLFVRAPNEVLIELVEAGPVPNPFP